MDMSLSSVRIINIQSKKSLLKLRFYKVLTSTYVNHDKAKSATKMDANKNDSRRL
ncbi:hypothetical protein Hanom_Chr14g01275231 [Helianthus anomalus]